MLTKPGYQDFYRNLFGFTGISYSPWEDRLLLVADTLHSENGVSCREYTLFNEEDRVEVFTLHTDGQTDSKCLPFEETKSADRAFDSVIRTLDSVGEWPCHIVVHHTAVPRWEFIYDEEYPDSAGPNQAGVIAHSAGQYRCLFFHTYCEDEGTTPVCHIYDSIWSLTEHDNELCSYPWTSENDSILLEALNGLQNPQDYSGDDSPIRFIQFKPYDE